MEKKIYFDIARVLRIKIAEGNYPLSSDLCDKDLVDAFFRNLSVHDYVFAVSKGSGKAKRIEMVRTYGAEPFIFNDENEISGINEKAFGKWIDAIGACS